MRTDAQTGPARGVAGARRGRVRNWCGALALAAILLPVAPTPVARAQDANADRMIELAPGATGRSVGPSTPTNPPAPSAGQPLIRTDQLPGLPTKVPDLTSRENFSAAMQIIVLLTVLSLAPAILIMMTSFTRIIIVLSLLRQALGTQQLPPNQVLIGLSLFMTFLVMGPTWGNINSTALQPYLDGRIQQREALDRAQIPLRDFMIAQIEAAGNDDDVYLFHGFSGKPEPKTWKEVETLTLIPAFMLSELKTAFLMGFKVYLPFLIIDMVISSVLISMGMMMLPPVLISLPFKLLLFVLVDGWRLITASLMGSFVLTGSA
jgi:flagellar biosynthetic protein FliP